MFVTKLTAVLNARSGVTLVWLNPCGLSGRMPWSRLQQVNKQKAENAERNQRAGVLGPPLLSVFPNANQLVSQRLQWPDQPMQKGLFALKKPGHEDPNRLRQSQDNQERTQQSEKFR